MTRGLRITHSRMAPSRNPSSSIIAHRGSSAKVPENTLAAFSAAWDQGAGAIELDVRLTKDGRIVAMHDATTGRTSCKDLNVAETDSHDLRSVDAGAWKARRFAGEKIPFLEEVLAEVPRYGRVFIELKCGAVILPELARVIENSPLKSSQVCLIGFDYELMALTKSTFPGLEVCWISRPKKNTLGLSPTPEELIERAVQARLDGLDLHKSYAINESFVRKVRAAGLSLYIWTVDNTRMARRFHDLGIDGITTNKPAKIARAIHRKGLFAKHDSAPPEAPHQAMPGTDGAGLPFPFSRPCFTRPCPDPKPSCRSSSSMDPNRSKPTFVTFISSAIQKSWWRFKSNL